MQDSIIRFLKDRPFYICALLFMCTIAVYWGVQNHEFIHLDDQKAIIDNPYIRSGLNWRSIVWAFSTVYYDYWHPLPWLTHILEYQIYGLNAGGYILTNVVIHGFNAILVFLTLRGLTGAYWRSALVAALFAVHPLNVESVAWAVERKNVLSAFFWLLTVLSYSSYAKKPSIRGYLLVVIWFCIGLTAKPFAVTLPMVLLLFDAWPLHRFNSPLQRRWALLEKIPLLAISCASAVMTYVIVRNTQGLYSFGTLDIGYRMANAALSYVHYLVSTIAPIGLAVYYPLPDAFNPYQVAAAMAVLCIISGASMLFWNKMPSLIIGWSWFVGTLIPVIGIIQTGSQSMADRFAYIPCLGLFIMIIWPLPNLVSKAPMFARRVGVLAAIALIVLYAIVAACQVSLWKNSETLFMHALRVTKNNYMIHNSLGAYYSQEGDTVQAMRHFAESIRIRPKFQFALYNAGLTMANAGDYAKAKKLLAAALSLDPSYAEAHYSIGACYEAEGNDSLALDAYTRAIALKPDDWMANYRSGCLYRKSGNDSLSEKCFLQALKSNPSSWETYLQLGLLSRKKGENNKAKAQFIQAINADPSRWEPLRALGDVLLSEHKPAAAGKLYEAAIRRAPDRAELHAKYGIALAIQEKLDSALIAFNSALRLSPGDSATMEYRGRVLRRMEEKRSGGVNEHAQRK